MTKEEFKTLLARYLQGTCNEDEKKVIDDWYYLVEFGEGSQLTSEEEKELEIRYWSSIDGHIQGRKMGNRRAEMRPKILSIHWLKAAAVILAAILTYTLFQFRSEKYQFVATTFKEHVPYMKYIENYSEKPKQIVLPDDSKITLEENARIYYLSTFNSSKREVFLQGKAFFEVAHDPNRPFLVYTGEVTTKVLGTSFTITAIPKDKNITVAVRSGKVSVFVPTSEFIFYKHQVETVLTPNQQVVYDRSAVTASKTLVRAPQAILSRAEMKRIQFKEAPVTEIFMALEKMYGVDIIYDEAKFRNCLLTTSISEGGIFNRIDIICKAIGASYTVDNTQIIIRGTGCN